MHFFSTLSWRNKGSCDEQLSSGSSATSKAWFPFLSAVSHAEVELVAGSHHYSEQDISVCCLFFFLLKHKCTFSKF